MTDPAPTPAISPTPSAEPPPYLGYAGGSKVLDLATWSGAVAKLLAKTQVVTKEIVVQGQPGKQKIQVVAHETDPPESRQVYSRKLPRPGPLPTLVAIADVPTKAKTVEHDHVVDLVHPHGGLDAVLHHIARHVVVKAREKQAKSIALREPVVGSAKDKLDPERHVILSVVMVL